MIPLRKWLALTLFLFVPALFAQTAKPKRVRVIVTKVTGMSESGDCLVFKVGARRYFVYAFGKEGDMYAHMVINSSTAKSSICLELNPDTKGLVDKVFDKCE